MGRLRTVALALVTGGLFAVGLLLGARALYRFVEEKKTELTAPGPPIGPPLLQLPARAAPLLHRPELRGVWIHVYAPQDWDAIARTLRAYNFNAIFLRVARGGESLYPSQVLPQEAWAQAAGADQLELAIRAAHRYGLELHAWKVCFHLGSLVRDAKRHGGSWAHFLDQLRASGRLATDSRGQIANWLNPADPRNLELELDVAREVLSRYDVDGYHLDYIRYPDEPSFDFDYGPISRALFESATGVKLTSWPEDVRVGPLGAEYLRWQQDVITETVWRIKGVRDQVRPAARLSAAVWRNIGLHRATIKQDWPNWARLRLVDFLVLMNYEKDLDRFCGQLEDALARVRGGVPLVAGIGSWRLSPDQVVRQVEAVRQLGADGFVLFSYNADAIEAQLQQLKQGPTRFPAEQACKGPFVSFQTASTAFQPPRGHTVFPAEEPLRIIVQSTATAALLCRIRARTFGGEYILDVPDVKLTSDNEARVTLPLTEEPVQLEVLAKLPGAEIPVACRSGWYVPVSRSEFRRLVSTKMPPSPFRKPAIGLYALSSDAEQLFAFFDELLPGHVVCVYHLSLKHLEPIDLLIMPPPLDLGELGPDSIRALRTWVEKGGHCVLIDDAIGRFPYPVLFPEIGQAKKRIEERTVVAPGEDVEWTHHCTGHWALEATDRSVTLLVSPNRSVPVAVRGAYGKGSVVLVGFDTEELEPGEMTPPARELWRRILRVTRGE